MKKYSIQDILDQESKLLDSAENRHGEYFRVAADFIDLFASFVNEVDPEAYIFSAFLSQARKHHMLAFLSFLKRHHVEGMLNMRFSLEAGLDAAYSIVFPQNDEFVSLANDGYIYSNKNSRHKRLQWLREHYPSGINNIMEIKGHIDKTCAHADLVYAFKNFKLSDNSNKYETPFFDIDDEFAERNNLWFSNSAALLLMDLFYGINKDNNLLHFSKDFVTNLHDLQKRNLALKRELMDSPRFKKANG